MMRNSAWLVLILIGALALGGCRPIAGPAAPITMPAPAASSGPSETACGPTPGQPISAMSIPTAALPAELVLADATEPGQRLAISGTVYAADCVTPLPGALLELWQANAAGEYTDLEGMLMTDDAGHYGIETIMPGMYGAPAHIHARIYHPTVQAIETEFVFAGDPLIPANTSNFAVITLGQDEAAAGAGLYGRYDIVLQPVE